MPRPGVEVTLIETPSPVSIPTDTGTWFATGLTDRGPVEAKLVRSVSELVTVFGDRVSYSPFYDAAESFFREGGDKLYVGRVVGPSATSGVKNLLDAYPSGAISLVATAVGPGDWSSSYKVAVVDGTASGTFRIHVNDSNDVVLEDSGDLADQNAAIYWSRFSQYIRLTLGASALNPAVLASTALSAGNDDRVNVTDTEWNNALALFTADLGPGQVSAPGRTTDTGHTQLVTHAEANNRVAILDPPNTADQTTLEASATAQDTRMGAMFAPWIVLPGITRTGTVRTVPPCGMVAGIIARNDPSLGPNHAGAGNFGISKFSIDLSQAAWNSTVSTALNESRVNVIRRSQGIIQVYGWRSLTDPTSDPDWIDFGNARLYMALSAELAAVGEGYMFEEIDGQNGQTINGFHDALAGVLLRHWNNRELFGDTPEQAFSVDTGPSVNTLDRIANLELHAVCGVKMAPFAEFIPIEVVKRRVTESV